MSIITEALKKAQYKTLSPKKPASQELFLGGSNKKNESRFKVFTIVSSAVFLIALLVFGFTLSYTRNAVRNIELSKSQDMPAPKEADLLAVEKEAAGLGVPGNVIQPANQEYVEYKSFITEVSAEPDVEINLSGIMYTPKRPLAVINNRILTEGDEIGSFKIMKIRYDRVLLAADDGSRLEVLLTR